MDANGLRSFMLCPDAGRHGWNAPGTAPALEPACGRLLAGVRLASRATLPPLRETATQASDIALQPAMVQDALGNCVWWDAATNELRATPALAAQLPGFDAISLALPARARPVRDLAWTGDDVLLVAGADGLWLLDTRARFVPTLCPAAAQPFLAERLAALGGNGAAALDTTRGRVALLRGRPLATTGVDRQREANDRFEARDADPDPLRLELLPALPLENGERAVALAGHDDGSLAVLLVAAGGGASLRLWRDGGSWSAPLPLAGPRFPHTLGWLDSRQPALLSDAVALDAQGQPQPERDLGVFAYRLPIGLREDLLAASRGSAPTLLPTGEFHPARDRTAGPFVGRIPGSGQRLCYPRLRADGRPEPAPVVRIAGVRRTPLARLANFKPEGAALTPFDSGDAGTTWHRLYVEAEVPANTALLVWLAAGDEAPDFDEDRSGWFPHLLGEPRALPEELRGLLPASTPRAAWLDQDSEVARGQSLLGAPRAAGSAGLFSLLIQRAGLATRALRGRRLWCVVELCGDGRATPQLAALRAYAGRRSYRDRHLPALYRESLSGAVADVPGKASPPDFLERFIGLFESLYTPMEDGIAAAHLYTDPRSCPDEALAWLASWIGLALEPGLPKLRARWMIANASALARCHGTLEGLQLALDIATDGAVTRGRVVVVEDYRLRRTFATILGADLADQQDPLTAGLSVSGNSIVGDSLFLGAEGAQEMLALFRVLEDDTAATAAARERVFQALFDGLAWRVTVLVHETTDADELRLIARVAEAAAPAHVRLRLVPARYPLLVSVAALVGADSFLRQADTPEAARLGSSRLGQTATLQGMGSLDPLLGAFGELQPPPSAIARPRARVSGPGHVLAGEPFALDGSASSAAPGRKLVEYRWTRLPLPPDEPTADPS